MKVIGRFQGMLGEITLLESEITGDRVYLEGEIFQSESSPTGMSRFPYVRMFENFLEPAQSVLLLGCGGGNLATMLTRTGKKVVVVDCNPESFEIARNYFGMPAEVVCVTADFRDYLAICRDTFDAIGIDVGGPGFAYETQFDEATCDALLARIRPGGRAVLNILVGGDFDGAPDVIGSKLSNHGFQAWILDQPGGPNRNLVIAVAPRSTGPALDRVKNELRLLNPMWALRPLRDTKRPGPSGSGSTSARGRHGLDR